MLSFAEAAEEGVEFFVEGVGGVVGEFAGVEEGAVADGAAFVVDVGLLGDGEAEHVDVAVGTGDVVFEVEGFAEDVVADVEVVDVGFVFGDVFVVAEVEPEAFAGGAAVDDVLADGDGIHVGEAFGAVHGLGPRGGGVLHEVVWGA
jgi:hypothetical protein